MTAKPDKTAFALFILLRQHQIPLPQPTMRTDLDIGAENPATTTVTGFFIPFFQVKRGRYPKPKTALGEDLN